LRRVHLQIVADVSAYTFRA